MSVDTGRVDRLDIRLEDCDRARWFAKGHRVDEHERVVAIEQFVAGRRSCAR